MIWKRKLITNYKGVQNYDFYRGDIFVSDVNNMEEMESFILSSYKVPKRNLLTIYFLRDASVCLSNNEVELGKGGMMGGHAPQNGDCGLWNKEGN